MKNLLTSFGLIILLLSSNVNYSKTITLPADTVVKVVLNEHVSSANTTVGQRVKASVAEDVTINDQIVIKKDTKVRAMVSAREKRKRLGKGGNVSLQFSSTRDINNNLIELGSALGREGRASTGSTVALTVLFGVPGLLKRGKDAVIPKGTVAEAFVLDDVQIEIAEIQEEEIIIETKEEVPVN